MAHANDDKLPLSNDSSALEVAVHDHPVAALLAAVLIGVMLSKTIF
jgi:hypothetical protein